MNKRVMMSALLCSILILGLPGCVQPSTDGNTSVDPPGTPTNQSPSTPTEEDLCIAHYLEKFGLTQENITLRYPEGGSCTWTPDDRYGAVDAAFIETIVDREDNEFTLGYNKGCCARHGYVGFEALVVGNANTSNYRLIKTSLCERLSNEVDNFTAQCMNGTFERTKGNLTVLSMKNDYSEGFGSPVTTLFISRACLESEAVSCSGEQALLEGNASISTIN